MNDQSDDPIDTDQDYDVSGQAMSGEDIARIIEELDAYLDRDGRPWATATTSGQARRYIAEVNNTLKIGRDREVSARKRALKVLASHRLSLAAAKHQARRAFLLEQFFPVWPLLKGVLVAKCTGTKLTQWFLTRLISSPDADALLGDLDERHEGRKSAAYWRQFVIAVIPLVFARVVGVLRLERIFRGSR